MVSHKLLVRWLEEAYGMESALVAQLSNQLADFAGHPEWESTMRNYLDRGTVHTTMLQECVTRQGGETSSTEKGGLTAFLATVRPSSSHDHGAIVRDLQLAFAALHFKMA